MYYIRTAKRGLEQYQHRAGRTARSLQKGLTVRTMEGRGGGVWEGGSGREGGAIGGRVGARACEAAGAGSGSRLATERKRER